MSFSFAFDVAADELDEELNLPSLSTLSISDDAQPSQSTSTVPHSEVSFTSLLETLPPLLSYTPVTVPLSSSSAAPSRHATFLRRDLFDARFQVLNQNEEDDHEEEEEEAGEKKDKGKEKEKIYIDEQTDLVKGVYEGGLKTWECSLDLVDCLDARGFAVDEQLNTERVRGRSVLEVGCGTAIPSCAVFARLLNEIRTSPTPEGAPRPRNTRLHLQDYNKQVLTLITLPNLLLTYAQHLSSPSPPTAAPDADEDPAPPSCPEPGELEVTPDFLADFEALLERENVELRFFEGEWSGMEETVGKVRGEEGMDGRPYDLVLTSETVYSVPSLEPLLNLLVAASASKEEDKANEGLCLVACKRIYFGVGGGELEFRRRVEERGGQVEAVWGEGEGKGKSSGVGRTVMSVKWARKDGEEEQ
ncbi:hypothetical protein JCM8547_007786 [Rhodosporidiobolus lusitaniae]